jgi:hypothetical protein
MLAASTFNFSSVATAETGKPFVLLDEKPKVIFYLSNSHHGNEGLQAHLDHAGFGQIKAVPYRGAGYQLGIDPKTGAWTEAAQGIVNTMLKEQKEKYHGIPAVVFYHGNGGMLGREGVQKGNPRTEGWTVRTDGEYFLQMRRLLLEAGFAEFYTMNHHYSTMGRPESAMKEDFRHNQLFLEAIAELNQTTGLTLGVDCWPISKPYLPLTVGSDFWHTTPFGNVVKTYPLMEAMAKNSGLKSYKKIDLDAYRVEYLRSCSPIQKVRVEGGDTYRVGDALPITWQIDAALYPVVDLYYEINDATRMVIATNVPAALERYTWKIPAQSPVWVKKGTPPPPMSTTGDLCRIRMALPATWNVRPLEVATLSENTFRVLSEGTTAGTAKPDPWSQVELQPAQEEKTGTVSGLTYRIARWPSFYRGAIALVVDESDEKVVRDMARSLADREHPDWVSFMADPATVSARTGLWQDVDHWGHELAWPAGLKALPANLSLTRTTRLFTVGAKDADLIVDGKQTEYRGIPDGLTSVRSFHLAEGSEATMRSLMERVIANRSLAIVTYGARGKDFELQVNALHDRHAELWNGPADRILRYAAEARNAVLTGPEKQAQSLAFELTDNLPNAVYREPLSIQVQLPSREWRSVAVTQGGKPIPGIVLTGHEGNTFVRFQAVPDDGPIRITKK